MEPRIQYARTPDGVSIAFYVMGDGPVIITMPMLPWSHVGKDRQDPSLRPLLDALPGTVIRYDNRGSGLSTRHVEDYSLDGHVRDLEAVVEQLGLSTFTLFGRQHSVPAAIEYAVRHTDSVSHLVLWLGYAKGADFSRVPQVQAVEEILEQNWDLYVESAARIGFAYRNEELSREVAAFFRQCVTQEDALAVHRARLGFDVSERLPDVKAPTLVVQGAEVGDWGLDVARDLAAGIPGASLVVEDFASIPSAISVFLGLVGDPSRRKAASASGLVTIVFTDMESSTALTQRLGDTKAQELVRAHNTIVRDALKACGGSEIKHTGDGIMASFPSASGALECAVAIQRAVSERDTEFVEASLRVRIGLNAGEPVAEEDDLFGVSVQLARRVCDHAEPGQIVVADVVRQLAAGKGFLFSDLGDVVPKGFEEPVRLYEVRWREEGQ